LIRGASSHPSSAAVAITTSV
jgi:hypothetical protein